jgi:hypothetical protein
MCEKQVAKSPQPYKMSKSRILRADSGQVLMTGIFKLTEQNFLSKTPFQLQIRGTFYC